jgi:hypothetical protein
MEYSYEKLMKEKNLQLSELPPDARVGIEAIAKVKRTIAITEEKGRKVGPATLTKLKANDKWATQEIQAYLQGKESNQSEEIPHNESEIQNEMEKEAKIEEVKIDPKGLAIEGELKKIHEAGKKTVTADELETLAPKCYDVLAENYDDNGENGIETTHYSIIETADEVFTITKK